MKKYLIYIVCFLAFFLSGCEFENLSERFAESTEYGDYDYREMYLNNDSKDLTDKDLEVFNTASRIYSLYIESYDSDYEKVLAAHDYIIKNCTYNKEAIDSDTLVDDDFHPYGVFVKEKAVCEGYARAFKMLMDIAGIDCIMVTGTVGEENTSHAWNMVKLEDDWYHVDVTFDDPYPETSEIIYLYLNITDEIIAKDHTWNRNVTPQAHADKFDYVKTNSQQYGADDEIQDLVRRCSENKTTYISFIWIKQEMITEELWRNALKDTNITNLSYSCIGVDGRRMYMVSFSY